MGFKDRITKVISSPEIDENDIESLINKGLKEITLKKDIDLTKTVNINTDNITIDGKNYAITSNREQIFNITGDNITLKNITFKKKTLPLKMHIQIRPEAPSTTGMGN